MGLLLILFSAILTLGTLILLHYIQHPIVVDSLQIKIWHIETHRHITVVKFGLCLFQQSNNWFLILRWYTTYQNT